MAGAKGSPRNALMRWLAQLHYNHIRNVEQLHGAVMSDQKSPLRGVMIADDLCLTRKRAFYRVDGKFAQPISVEEVAANYDLTALQSQYRKATDSWKTTRRFARR
jgi:hypothetical protein